jgi:hypothetical protein
MSIRLHAGQSRVYEDLFVHRVNRFAVVCCSRGWGKSFMLGTSGVTAAFELMELDESVPHKYVYLIAPTYGDVTDIYYPLINYELGLEPFCIKTSRDAGRFYLPRNVEIRLLSYEAVERMRGKGAYFAGWDEPSACQTGLGPEKFWQGVVQPAVITRWSPMRAKHFGARSPGRAAFVGTPKGYNDFYKLYNYQEVDPLWKSYHYDYKSSPFLDADEIERIKHTVDPLEFNREYLARFEDSGNSVFYCFDRKVNVRNDLEDFGEGEDVHVWIDFNVGIMAAAAFAVRGKQIHVLDEFKGHPDTESLAENIKARYKKDGNRIYAYPDPTGRSRKSSAPVGRTDFSILESHGMRCLARPKSPPLVDSVTAVNRKFKNAAGGSDMFIRPSCKGVIESFERTVWVDGNPDTAAICKKDGVEHYSDGGRYAVEYLFPVLKGQKVAHRGFNF